MEPWQTSQTNLTDISIASEELSRRTPPSPDLLAQNRALQKLARNSQLRLTRCSKHWWRSPEISAVQAALESA